MPRAKPVQREKGEQAAIVQLLRAIGADVYVLGTRRSTGRNCPHCRTFVPNHDMGTRQTPGIPDLFAWVPSSGMTYALWMEVKAPGGRLRPEQATFRDHAMRSLVSHLVGGLDDVIAWLMERGLLKGTQVPYYRLRKEA